jgi:D-alanyl-D-alanine carboxypeptidase
MNAIEIALVSAFVFLSVKCSEVSLSSDLPQKNKGIEVMNDSLPVRDISRLFAQKAYLTGKINYADYPDFKVIASEHTTKANEYLRGDVYEAFLRMRAEAMKEGISLTIVSGARNFARQKNIWEAKWNGERKVEGKNLALEVKDSAERARLILLYSSMPGTSRHHWGTDIDINSLEDDYFLTGKGKSEYEWLCRRAVEFGFCQVYSPKGKDRPYGYEEEKWHWSYMPVASVLLSNFLAQISESDISGFAGDKTATALKVKERYVAGINPACR